MTKQSEAVSSTQPEESTIPCAMCGSNMQKEELGWYCNSCQPRRWAASRPYEIGEAERMKDPEGASHENADRRDAAELEQNKAAVASLGALSATPSLRNERSAELLEREGAEREAFVAWKFRVSWNRRRGLNDNDTTGIDLMLDFAYRAGAAQRGHVSDSEGGNRNG
jgi:hypothetical protein